MADFVRNPPAAGKRPGSPDGEQAGPKNKRGCKENHAYSRFLRAFDDYEDRPLPRFSDDCIVYTSQPDRPDPDDYWCFLGGPAPHESWSCKPISSSCMKHCILDSSAARRPYGTRFWNGQECYALHVKAGTRALAVSLPDNLKARQRDYSEIIFPPGTYYERTEIIDKVEVDGKVEFFYRINVSSPKEPPSETLLPMYYDKESEARVSAAIGTKTADIREADILNESGFNAEQGDEKQNSVCGKLAQESREHLLYLWTSHNEVARAFYAYSLGLSQWFKRAFAAAEDFRLNRRELVSPNSERAGDWIYMVRQVVTTDEYKSNHMKEYKPEESEGCEAPTRPSSAYSYLYDA